MQKTWTKQTNQKYADEPAYPCSLIKIIVVRCMDGITAVRVSIVAEHAG